MTTCTWAEYEDIDNDDNDSEYETYYNTECDNKFYKGSYNNVRNFRYCSWCGDEIKRIKGD